MVWYIIIMKKINISDSNTAMSVLCSQFGTLSFLTLKQVSIRAPLPGHGPKKNDVRLLLFLVGKWRPFGPSLLDS